MAGPETRVRDELARIQRHLQTLFEETLLRAGYAHDEMVPPGTWAPAIDLVETDDSFVLSAEIPGVALEDVEIHVAGRRLDVSGRRRAPSEDRRFFQMERSYGPFRRSVELPAEVDAEALTVDLEAGVLTVILPKQPGEGPGEAGRPAAIEGG